MEPTIENQPAYTRPEKSKKGCPLAVAIVLAVLAISGIGFGIFELFNKKTETIIADCERSDCQNTEKQNTEPQQQKSPTLPGNYRLYANESYETDSSRGFEYANINSDGSRIVLSMDNEEHIINNIDGNITEIHGADFGITPDGGAFLFLIEDGTVEYIPLHDAHKNQKYESYGKISNLTNIIKFLDVDTAGPSGITVLAQDEEGNLYDLKDYIDDSLLGEY